MRKICAIVLFLLAACGTPPAPAQRQSGFSGPLSGGGFGGSTWSRGTGIPAIACANGDLFSRTDGGASTTLYVCTATNTWTAK